MTEIATLGIYGDIACSTNTMSFGELKCILAKQYDAKFIAIKTLNGKSFSFSEIEVISEK